MKSNNNCRMSQETFWIEKAKIEDAAPIAQIESISFSHPWSEQSVLDELRSSNTCFLVARSGDQLAGYISFRFILDEGYINNIAVHPVYRKQGIGDTLLEHALVCGGEKGLTFLTLEVRPSNKSAIQLYNKHKFQQVGMRKAFYTDPSEDALLMTYTYGERK